jgi:hypothetical protein
MNNEIGDGTITEIPKALKTQSAKNSLVASAKISFFVVCYTEQAYFFRCL